MFKSLGAIVILLYGFLFIALIYALSSKNRHD